MPTELEYQTVTIPISPNFQDEIAALIKQRWEVLPGSTAVAVYNLVRIKQSAENQIPQAAGIGGFGELHIDETKIVHLRGGVMGPDGVLRGAKIVRPDGTVEEPKVLDGEAKLG